MTAQSGTGGGLTDQVKERAGDTVHEARVKGRDAVEGQVDTRSTQAGESLGDVADQAHEVSDTLRSQGNDTVAQLVDQAAGYTERAATYLRDSSATTILDDLENLARKQPWAVAAGGLVLGFVAARVLRASRSNLDHSGSGMRDHSRDLEGYGTGSGYSAGAGYGSGYVPGPRATTPSPTTGASEDLVVGSPAATPGTTPGTTGEGYGRGGL